MAKPRTLYLCSNCGNTQSRWMGKCPDCGTWDSLSPTTLDPAGDKDPQKGLVAAWAELNEGSTPELLGAKPIGALGEAGATPTRLSSGIGELDRVLGGPKGAAGLVAGSAVLVGGEPGIGKSTLLLQAAAAWASRGTRVLYVSSEESAQQVQQRALRLLGAESAALPPAVAVNLHVLSDTNLARIVEQVRKISPGVVVIDSIQMIYKSDLPAAPGSVTQLRRCCAELVYLAKLSGIPVILVGHVTKEGNLAGPRLLEHVVDAVLYFEGDRYHSHRVVRAVKNRFGTTLEIGLFEMTGRGLREVPEGTGVAALTGATSRPGSVVCPVLSGTRCVMVEVQALTATGFLGAAKRKSSGLDPSRLAMLIAVLEQHAGLRLADRDVFASSVGGIRVIEPAADLAILLAIAGAHYRKALGDAIAVAGEVGLGGEIRPVPQSDARVLEASRLGYKMLVLPHGGHAPATGAAKSLEIKRVRTVDDAIALLG
ncbi:MAG: DNA repair protein RadA [Planctomycetota bacterium]|nr:DNA repair protein RadA [Planctomycetota bacterium]